MSARFNKSTSAYVPRAMCCKVCKDAGEPENVYSSHYVKDRDGNTTCPKLKAIVCHNCNKRGHTTNYCKAPAKSATNTTSTAPEPAKKQATELPKLPGASRFACLVESDSEDEELLERKHARPRRNAPSSAFQPIQSQEKTTVSSNVSTSKLFNITDEFPALAPAAVAKALTTDTKTISYAGMAAKPSAPKPVKQTIVVSEPKYQRPASPDTPPPGVTWALARDLDWTIMDSDDEYACGASDDEDW